jgi:Amt family ammonium transporter
MGALIIGIVVSCISFSAIKIKNTLKADDALDVFGVHGCGGLWGCLATGLFSTVSVNSAAHNGWLNGGTFAGAMLPQLEDAGATILFAVVGTFVIGKIVGLICGGLRATESAEEDGLDLADHGEAGYSADSAGVPAYATIG